MNETKDKLTKWEAGSELAKAMDELAEIKTNLEGWPEIQSAINKCQDIIRSRFVASGMEEVMGFGI